jgi:hypothetical protein
MSYCQKSKKKYSEFESSMKILPSSGTRFHKVGLREKVQISKCKLFEKYLGPLQRSIVIRSFKPSKIWRNVDWYIVTGVSEKVHVSVSGSKQCKATVHSCCFVQTLKMATISTSQTSVTVYQSTRLHIHVDTNIQWHPYDNTKLDVVITFCDI